VDLVEEEHLTLGEPGEDGRQVAGVLDGRAGGDPDRRRHLRGDDQSEGGLAEARRPGEQDMVGGGSPVACAGKHEVELLADATLAAELGQ